MSSDCTAEALLAMNAAPLCRTAAPLAAPTSLGPAECQNLAWAMQMEWLEPNGRAGFASGTVGGVPTRRFHGLLLVARRPPHDRVMLVPHLEQWLETPSGVFPIATSVYAGAIDPRGYHACTGFTPRPFPTWQLDAGGVKLERAILCPRGRDLVVVRWRLCGAAPGPVRLRLRPQIACRPYNEVLPEGLSLHEEAERGEGYVRFRPRPDFPAITALFKGDYRHQPSWTSEVDYTADEARGEPWRERWWSPGEILLTLPPSGEVALAFSAEDGEAGDPLALAAAEESRRRAEDPPSSGDSLFDALRGAAADYLVATEREASVIAGFPWFGAWTRDTFTALPGLCLVTGKHAVARRIIETFVPHLDRGMLPNLLPREGERSGPISLDASLWFIIAVSRYLAYTGDEDMVQRTAWPAVQAILDGYRAGPRPEIRVDADGLVTGASDDAPLTWMDALYEGKVMTPRRGKPVEVQALWIASLEAGRALADRFGDKAYARSCELVRARAVASFRERFWDDEVGYLRDVIDGPEGDDSTLRPNQVFALSLCPGLLPPEREARVLAVLRERLLTPVGLRTLSREDPSYHRHYQGDRAHRDPAYHQGTVWPFLLGPFVQAFARVHGGTPEARKEARGLLADIEAHLARGGCLGHLCEIFDAEPPHVPRGCVAQAWSVGELLSALHEVVLGRGPGRPG